jgi:DNA-binding transcriptional MocR family regulator
MKPSSAPPLLSAYGEASLTSSPVNRMMAAYAASFRDGVDINLGVGYVNEATLPRAGVRRGLDAVLDDPVRYRAALNYGGPKGSTNLIDAVRRWYLAHGPDGVDAAVLDHRHILIGPNGATSLLESLALLLRGGIVVVADPCYYIYCDVLQRAGFELLPVPEDEQGLSVDGLRSALEELGPRCEEISFVYVVTVHNPTSTVLSNPRRAELLKLVTELSANLGRQIPLIADRAYEDLIHDEALPRPRSMLADDDAGIVYEIGTLSKIIAPALRIGYVVAPSGPLIEALTQRTSDAGFSAPLVTQEISSWLLDHLVVEQIRQVNDGYRHKARIVGEWIHQHLGPYLQDLHGGQAGFYYYLTFNTIETGMDSPFQRFLTRATGDAALDGPAHAPAPRVSYIPGEFCVVPHGQLADIGRRQLRLSYGFEELEKIDTAIHCMAQACAWARDAST